MLQEENGPFGIFARLQAWVGSLKWKPGNLNDGFFCFYCMSVWLSAIIALFIATNIITFILLTLAMSTGAIFIDLAHDKLKQ